MIGGDRLRAELASLSAVEAAPRLLGARLRCVVAPDAVWLADPSFAGEVELRIVEVEAYSGEGDPGSHGSRGMTPRTAVMFGEAGRLYAYFTYGMHICGNVVVGPTGTCAAVLLRGAEVVRGVDLARARRMATRRPTAKPLRDADLAAGPANLIRALGATLADNGADLCAEPAGSIELEMVEQDEHDAFASRIRRSLRTGVSGPGGLAPYEWRFWLDGADGVSKYQPHPTLRDAVKGVAPSWYG